MKETNENKNWELITKHLVNELNAEEEKEFSLWLAEDIQHRDELKEAKKIWQLSDQKNIHLFNSDNGWNKMHQRIHVSSKSITNRKIYINILRIAASLLMITALSYTLYYYVGKSNYIEITATTTMKDSPIILSDGTEVYLNKGAHLTYPKKFGSSTRTVKLTGEAFFEVARNIQHPFIIKTHKANIKVLGTSFNVIANCTSDSVQVAVQTGIVELSSLLNNDTILIRKGNTGVFYANPNKLKRIATNVNMNSFAWKTNNITFREANLLDVTQTLERIFGEKIIIGNEILKKCQITAEFKNQNLAKILETMNVTHGIQINKKDKKYMLTGSSCK